MSDLRERLADFNPHLVLLPERYDLAFIGLMERFGQEPVAAYDYETVIAVNEADGMTHEEAVEWFLYNQLGAWVGDYTPCFVHSREGIV